MNLLRPSPIVSPAPTVTVGGSSRRQELNAYDQKGNREVTTKTTVLPVSGMTCIGCENSIWFADTSLEGVRRVNPDRRTKSVEVGYRVVGS